MCIHTQSSLQHECLKVYLPSFVTAINLLLVSRILFRCRLEWMSMSPHLTIYGWRHTLRIWGSTLLTQTVKAPTSPLNFQDLNVECVSGPISTQQLTLLCRICFYVKFWLWLILFVLNLRFRGQTSCMFYHCQFDHTWRPLNWNLTRIGVIKVKPPTGTLVTKIGPRGHYCTKIWDRG